MDERQRRVDHFNAGAAGHPDEASYESGQRELVRSVHGSKDPDKLFTGRSPTALTPWPAAAGRKGQQLYDREAVRSELSREPRTVDIDPRILKSTQGGLVRAGVEHYMSGKYEETGETYADQHNVGNQFPFVVTKPTNSPHADMPTHEHVIISGHHRAAAALVRGRKLTTRWIEQE